MRTVRGTAGPVHDVIEANSLLTGRRWISLSTRATRARTSGQTARLGQFDFWAVGVLRSAVHFSQLTQLQLKYSAMAPARRPKVKTATLSVRLDPVIKAAAEAAAVLERRSVTGLLEVLILNHCRTLGISPDSYTKESRK